jgi:hypothetical protein
MITYHHEVVYIYQFIPSSNEYCLQCINVVHPNLEKLTEQIITIPQYQILVTTMVNINK